VACHQLRRWLAASAWPADQLPDIVLALSEAVTNAAEHAYRNRPPGMIELHGGIELAPGGRRRVTLTVRDHRRWRRPPANDADRRRGIPLMRACMDTITITEPDDRKGTQVILRSRAIPTPG
jgi:anti-sigma regulatory factor (Ser/Thr protein kinase)